MLWKCGGKAKASELLRCAKVKVSAFFSLFLDNEQKDQCLTANPVKKYMHGLLKRLPRDPMTFNITQHVQSVYIEIDVLDYLR